MRKLCPNDRAISVNLSLPSSILEIIDDYAEHAKISRSALVRSALYFAYGINGGDEDLLEINNDITHYILERGRKENGNITEIRK